MWTGGASVVAKAQEGMRGGGAKWNRVTARCLAVRPDTRDLVVGMEDGTLFHTPRYGVQPRPSRYRPSKDELESLSARAATSVSFSSFPSSSPIPDSILTLVGNATGAVYLYVARRCYPLKVWDTFTKSPIVRVLWSKTRPAVFVVLDDSSRLFFFNLLGNVAAPVHIESVQESQIVDIMAPDPSPTARGVKVRFFIRNPSRPPTTALLPSLCCTPLLHRLPSSFDGVLKGPLHQTRCLNIRLPSFYVFQATIAVGFKSGHIQMHTLQSMYAEPIKDEDTKVRTLVEAWL